MKGSKIGSEEKRGKAKKTVPCKNEEAIYAALGLEYTPPELRGDFLGKLKPLEKKKLPRPGFRKGYPGNIPLPYKLQRWDKYIVEMAEAAQKLGWEYLGIADHSKIAVYANGLTEERVKKQQKEINTLNQKWPNFRIFSGTEVDILPTGALDFSDKILSTFDYVVASVTVVSK